MISVKERRLLAKLLLALSERTPMKETQTSENLWKDWTKDDKESLSVDFKRMLGDEARELDLEKMDLSWAELLNYLHVKIRLPIFPAGKYALFLSEGEKKELIENLRLAESIIDWDNFDRVRFETPDHQKSDLGIMISDIVEMETDAEVMDSIIEVTSIAEGLLEGVLKDKDSESVKSLQKSVDIIHKFLDF